MLRSIYIIILCKGHCCYFVWAGLSSNLTLIYGTDYVATSEQIDLWPGSRNLTHCKSGLLVLKFLCVKISWLSSFGQFRGFHGRYSSVDVYSDAVCVCRLTLAFVGMWYLFPWVVIFMSGRFSSDYGGEVGQLRRSFVRDVCGQNHKWVRWDRSRSRPVGTVKW